MSIIIPTSVKAAIDRHVEFGEEPNKFVDAVLKNDLMLATAYADDNNIHYLKEIVMYCFNDIPSKSWGNDERVKEWRRERRARRKEYERSQNSD